MRFLTIFMFVSLLTGKIFAQDKTVAREFYQVDDEFIQRVNRIATKEPVDTKYEETKSNYIISEMDSTRLRVEKRLESDKQNLKYYHDLPYWGLKGKIKKITISRYLAGYDANKKVVTRMNNGQVPITVNYRRVTFDENGYPSDYTETSIVRGISKTVSRQSKYIGPTLFEEVEYNETGANRKKYMGRRDRFDVIFKERNGNKNGEINSFFNQKKALVYNNYLDDKGNNIVETVYFKNNLPTKIEQKVSGQLNYKSDTKYNADNTIKQTTQIIVDTKPFTRYFKYTEKDSHDNWTERVCYNNDKLPMWLEKAKYEYEYDDTDASVDADAISIEPLSSDSTNIIMQTDIIQLTDSVSSK